jgi:anti-sigma B factor antagonist
MGFTVERTPGPDGICVAVAGEVDIDSAPRMRRALAAAVREASQVVVDLGAVTFLDSSGLSALIATQQGADAAGVTLRLQHVPPAVLRLLTMTGVSSLFDITSPPATELPAVPGR